MEVVSNMTGNVWKLTVKQGDQVEAGQEVVILESMKMEIPIETEVSGTVAEIVVNEGDFIHEGDIILKLQEA